MKVLNYEAHHVLGVEDIRFDLEGRHLFLVGGKNGQGKTSALNALLMALCGRSGMNYPGVSLKNGEDEGWVKVHLSGSEELHEPDGLTVELKLRRKLGGQVVEEFRILDSTGEEAPEPRTLLKRLYQFAAFDPLSFERLDKKAKKETIQKLVGLDFTEQQKKYKALYEERTLKNKELKNATAALDGLKEHVGVPEKEISSVELLEELERRQGVNKGHAKKREELANNVLAQEQNEASGDELCRQILELERRLKEVTQKAVVLKGLGESLSSECSGLKDLDVDSVRQQMKDAEETNKKIRENQRRKEAASKAEKLRREANQLTDDLDKITHYQEKAVKEAKFPVSGMGFTEDGISFNGLPYEQASKHDRVLASVDIGVALKPELRLFVCENGGDLDTETLKALDEKLKEHDYQMIVELVTRTKEDEDLCAVVIKDGAVVGAEARIDSQEEKTPEKTEEV